MDNSHPYNQDLDDVPAPSDHGASILHGNSATFSDGMYRTALGTGSGIGLSRHGLEALSAAATRGAYGGMPPGPESGIARSAMSYAQNPTPHGEQPQQGTRSDVQLAPPTADTPASPSHQVNLGLHAASETSPLIDPNLHSPINGHDAFLDPALSAHEPMSAGKTEGPAEREHEVAFLLRQFAENPGQW